MLVYVINMDGEPLMPSRRCGKIRRLLRDGRAEVVRRTPFTIRLLYNTGGAVQDVTLGVDSGSAVVGISAATDSRVLFEAEVELRNDITGKLSTRREARRARRYRKTRYREPRFDNRRRGKGWLAPSVRNRIDTHLTIVRKVHEILPISKTVVETASFDIQKIKDDGISGADYQNGEQLGFWNVREYVLFRDGHTCQCCKGKSRDKVLNVHHIESRKTGGDAPNNLITLCRTYHDGYHRGTVELPDSIHRGMRFRDAAFMGIMRWAFYNELEEEYEDVSMTYGYITKHERIMHGLPKAHHIDARCISGHPSALPDGDVYHYRKVRRHNRQIHKFSVGKNGVRKRNQAPFEVHGFRLFDRVSYKGGQYFVFGRRSSGFFDIRAMNGEKVNKGSVSCKKLRLTGHTNGYLIERRRRSPLTAEDASV